MSTVIDLGNGHSLRTLVLRQDGPRVGYILDHPDPKSETGRCSGSIWVMPFGDHFVWTVVQPEPNLTLDPSFQCANCGDHGFIRDGQWVPA